MYVGARNYGKKYNLILANDVDSLYYVGGSSTGGFISASQLTHNVRYPEDANGIDIINEPLVGFQVLSDFWGENTKTFEARLRNVRFQVIDQATGTQVRDDDNVEMCLAFSNTEFKNSYPNGRKINANVQQFLDEANTKFIQDYSVSDLGQGFVQFTWQVVPEKDNYKRIMFPNQFEW